MIKKLILGLMVSISLCSLNANGQALADIQTPKIVPPSPDAAALGKYAQIPVDKSTGIPNISVPIYEIKTSRFSLPISLSYHASGVKVDETASWVGLGWSLNAGGVVTRSIQGIRDEYAGTGYLNSAAPPSVSSLFANFHADSSYLENIVALTQDSQPDNFFYNFVNQSGAFIYGEDKKPITIPYKPVKIILQQDSATRTSSFTIYDEQGNNYWFHDREMSTNAAAGLTGPSSWYLTQMVSADKSDTIKFVYRTDSVAFADNNFSFTQKLGPLSSPLGLWPMTTNWNPSSVTQIHISSILFKGGKVDFKQRGGRQDMGIVSLDSVIVSNYDYNQKEYNRLKSFKLLTGYSYSTIPNQTGFYSDEKSKYRLILTGLSENDQNNSAVKTHQFTYNSTMLPPMHNFGQDKWGYYNGNYTNQSLLEAQNVISVVFPNTGYSVYTIGSGQGGNRSVSPTYMQAGILQQITYPTKGYTVFNYEPNQYSAPAITDTVVMAGAVGYYHETATTSFTPLVSGPIAFHMYILSTGTTYTTSSSNINIKQGATTIYTQDASATADFNQNIVLTLTAGTTYTLNASAHGSTSSSSVHPQAYITTEYQITGSNVATNVGGLRVKSVKNYDSNGTIISTETYKYGTVGAPESGIGDFLTNSSLMVTHSLRNTQFTYGNVGGPSVQPETVYSNTSVYPLSSLSGSPVAYESVTIYHGDTVQNIGKSIYNYSITTDSTLIYTSPLTVVPLYVLSYDVHGNPYYRAWSAGTGSFFVAAGAPVMGIKPVPLMWENGEPISEAHYRNNGSGGYLLQQSKYTNYKLASRTAGRGLSVQFAFDFYACSRSTYQPYTNINDFIIYDYPISNGSRVPNQTITTNYANDGVTPLTIDTIKYFYDNHAHMYPTRIRSYDGKGDSLLKTVMYPQDMPQTGIYGTMTAANIISPVIQFTDTKNATQMEQSVTNYASTSGIINPSTVSLQIMANAAETRLNYQNYDPVTGNLLTVSKQGGPPVSYIWGYKGEYPVAEVKNALAKNIFYESFEDGNGNSAGTDANSGYYSRTGGYTKTLGTTTALTNGSYVLSYWQKSGAAWNFVSTPASVTAGTYAISLSGQVDDIRFYPVGALMTTYTYNPTVGVTSVTDAKNQVTYYEYDSFLRLLNIKDKDGNIVKSFCYNYAGQATGCSVNPLLPPPPPTYAFTLTNSTGVSGFVAQFSGVGNFNFPASGSTTVNIPAGSYTVTINPINAPTLRKFLLGARTPVTAPGYTFSTVVVGPTGTETPLIIQNP